MYTSSDKSTSATNPLILDANGKAQVWADGRYKFVVKTSADVTLYTLDNLLYGFDDTTVLLGGTSTGSANAQTVSVPATVESYANGQRVTFIAGYTNTGATTLRFNSLSVISIVKGPSASALQAGDIVAGQMYACTYFGGSFYLENYPTLADIQRSRTQILSSVSGTNTIIGSVTPALTSYELGSIFRFKATATNTGAVTLAINGLTPTQAVQLNNAALVGGEIVANRWYEVVYDGTSFQLLNPAQEAAPKWGGTTGGTSTAFTITPSPAIAAYAAGQRFSFIANAANGASATLAVNGLAAKTMLRQGTALVGNEFKISDVIEVEYDGTNFQILNVPAAPLYADRTNNRVGVGTTSPLDSLQIGVHSAVTPSDSSGSPGSIYGFNHYYSTGSKAIATGARTATVELGNAGGFLKATTATQTAGSALSGMNTYLQWGSSADLFDILTNNTLRVRVDTSGNILIKTTAANNTTPGTYFSSPGATYANNLTFVKTFSGTQNGILNYHNGTYVGGVDFTNTTTSFPTSSDYRLKENVVEIEGGLDRLMNLKPVRFNFIAEPEQTVDGFLAHEVQEVVPNAVSGTKDAVNPDGTAKIQSLDHSKLVPLLTAAIQELKAKVEALEARVDMLEA
jgi:hypothetical protein